MNIILTPKGGSKLYLDLLPEKVHFGGQGKFMTYSIISLGDVKIPRGNGLEEVSWKGIFPGKSRKNERVVKSDYFRTPEKYVNLFRSWRDKGKKLNLKVTKTGLNIDVYVESFEGDYTGGHGDFQYEVKFVEAIDIKISKVSKKKSRKASKKSKKNSSTKYKSYTVKKGDTVSKIAQKKLKKTSRYKEIYKLNKKVIENAAKKHGRKNSGNGKYLYAGTKLKIPAK